MTIKSMTNRKCNHRGERGKGHTIIGVVLAVAGFFWLAKKVGWIPVAVGGPAIFGPTVTIAVGIAIFLSTRRHHTKHDTDALPANTEQLGQ
jgi:hypothetical protein